MSETNHDQIHQLQELALRLGDSLEASERRAKRMDKRLRWGAAIGLGGLTLALAIWFKPMSSALASPQSHSMEMFAQALEGLKPGMGKNENLVQFVDDFAALIHNLRVMTDDAGMMMQAAWGDAVVQAQQESKQVIGQVSSCDAVQDPANKTVRKLRTNYPLGVFSTGYFCHKGQSLEQIAALPTQAYNEPLLKAASNTMVDMGVVMTRIRQDSNIFRQWLASGGGEQALGSISNELHFLNASIANMVRDMSVMSYSVGSTMGKAGSWMPW